MCIKTRKGLIKQLIVWITSYLLLSKIAVHYFDAYSSYHTTSKIYVEFPIEYYQIIPSKVVPLVSLQFKHIILYKYIRFVSAITGFIGFMLKPWLSAGDKPSKYGDIVSQTMVLLDQAFEMTNIQRFVKVKQITLIMQTILD